MATGKFQKIILGSNLTGTDNLDDTITIDATGGGGSGDVSTDTIWDAKGDLAVGTGADTADNLPVGTDGQIIVADSGETTGLNWTDLETVMVATWQGQLPLAAFTGAVWRVPYLDGVSATFDLTRAYARVEATGASNDTIVLETSPPGSFVATTITTLTITAGNNDDEDTTSLGSVDSGDLVRINWTAVGHTDQPNYTVELEGVKA